MRASNQIPLFYPGREQFCDSVPLDVRVALPGVRESLCSDVQRPRCQTLPLLASVRHVTLIESIVKGPLFSKFHFDIVS